MYVVAEGVESEAQHEFLKSRGCDLVQGYLTGRPLDFAAFHLRLSEEHTHPRPTLLADGHDPLTVLAR